MNHYPFTLKPLPYAYDALEPYIDARTVEIHHDKHLQTYVNNLNTALANHPELHDKSLYELLTGIDGLPAEIQTAVRNNGGGVWNHNFYFDSLMGDAPTAPIGSLAAAIDRDFGSYEGLRSRWAAASLSVFGSGWAILAADDEKKLQIITVPNQATALDKGLVGIAPIDVWEHAYYLKYQNVRADYVNNIFNIINWSAAEDRFCSI